MSGPRTLFRGIGFFGFLGFFVFFGFPRVFLIFGSGSFYRLLGPPKTKKPRGKPKKTKNLEENQKKQKKQKKQRILRNVWAKDFVQRHWFFWFFRFFCFFGFPRVFLIFGSGSFYRLLGPPITQEPRGKPKKNRKKHSVLRNVWAPFFRCSDVLRVFLFFLLCGFLVFGFWLW